MWTAIQDAADKKSWRTKEYFILRLILEVINNSFAAGYSFLINPALLLFDNFYSIV